jgi:hypothetical protein
MEVMEDLMEGLPSWRDYVIVLFLSVFHQRVGEVLADSSLAY